MKTRGKLQISKEMLQSTLGIPEDVELVGLQYEMDREVLVIYLTSEEVKEGWTFEVGETHTIPHSDIRLWEEAMKQRVVDSFKHLTEHHSNAEFSRLLEKENQ